MEKEKSNTILLTVIGVSTLLVTLVGATFAYFTATLNVESTQSVMVVTATPAGLTYAGPNAINIDNAIPGDSDDADFTVSNPAASEGKTVYTQTYDLDLVIDSNSFVNTDSTDDDTDTDDGQLLIAITPSTDGDNEPVTNGSFAEPYDATDSTVSMKGLKVPIVKAQIIEPGETHTYNLAVSFVELSKEQNNNQGQEFSAHVEISNPRTLSE